MDFKIYFTITLGLCDHILPISYCSTHYVNESNNLCTSLEAAATAALLDDEAHPGH